MRGQSNLPALAIALVALTGAMVVGLAIADGAFSAADRDATDRQLAVGVSEYLTGADGPLTTRENVVNASAVEAFDAAALRDAVPGVADRDVKVRLGNEPIAATDADVAGPSIERLVLIESTQSVALSDAFEGAERSVTLPRRTSRVDVRIDPAADANVTAVRIDDRVVRRNTSGLAGAFEIEPSRYRTATVSIDADGPLATDDVAVTYYPARTEKALLEVTVGA